MPHSGDQQDTRGPTGIAGVLRNLGRLNRSHPASPAITVPNNGIRTSGPEYFGGPPNNEVLFVQLKPGSPIPDRIAAAAQFRSIVADYALSSVTEIWLAAQDMLDPHYPPDARQAALRLMTACIKQSEPSSLDRLQYYRIISSHPCVEDFDDQLLALVALTNNGKNVTSFEKDILVLLAKWIKVWFKEAGQARQARKRDNGPAAALSAGEFNFSQLMKFVTDIVKFNHSAFEERQVNALLSEILSVCKKTTSRDDIKYSLTFIDALITYGYIPRQTLNQCIEVLCGAYTTVKELADSTWSAVANLCRSYMAHNTILVLREILEAPSKKSSRTNNSLRGAVYFLERLLMANEADGLPAIQFSAVMLSFRAALTANNARLDVDVVKAISSAFHNEEVMSHVTFDEWAVPLGILAQCSGRTTERADGTRLETSNITSPGEVGRPASVHSRDKDNIGNAISTSLLQMIILLEAQCITHKDPTLVENVMDFFTRVHGHLPDSAADMVIDYYATEHLCYPSCTDWMANIQQLLGMFFRSKIRPSRLRISVLTLIKDVYETIKDVCDETELHSMVLSIFGDIQEETDGKVLDALVRIAVDIAGDGNKALFDKIINTLVVFIPSQEQFTGPTTANDKNHDRAPDDVRPASIISQGHCFGSQLNIITTGLVRIFIRNMHTSAQKSARVFLEIVRVAGCSVADVDARLTAMRLLFRIRSDAEHAILLVESTESESMAAFLGRLSKPSEDRDGKDSATFHKEDDNSSHSRLNRNNSVAPPPVPSRTVSRSAIEKSDKQPRVILWSYPEKRPLPEHFTEESSPVLVTYKDPPSADHVNGDAPPEKLLLKENCVRMSLWMEVLIPIIQKGTSWEIYSYVLVNLASQVSNKTAFRNCTPHIKFLRAYICDQLHTNKIPNTDLPPELRKADIAVVLIHLLTTLICYHEHFARNEQEAIVKAFQLGLHSWQRTAKPCIHALSVCCYELPMPTSKFLTGILTKLSQIITSSAVSVHILEFLSALARLPNLYTNFTEPDFRNVFGIAFRYIQHTKATTTQQMQRPGYPGRAQKEFPDTPHPEQSQLPQYVLTLAYHVLTTWFLALRLSERSKYVPWITRGLVLGDNTNSKDYIDEQSQACIDMLQRFTYSDAESKHSAVRTSFDNNPYIHTRNWLHGMSIISVRMDTLTGDSEFTIRKPSGTSSYRLSLRSPEQNVAAPRMPDGADLHELNNVITTGLDKHQHHPFVMPSHIILQLLASVGGSIAENCSRPILLPDDQRTQLALDVFDMIPVVDFHKIGVVYVGAGQNKEQEILQNVMGSTDYTEFITGLGNLISLKGTKINTGGLDTEFNSDGEFGIFWSDRITEIIFHITTMMPVNLGHDPQCTMKKKHIGNDFVNIVFNNSGIPYAFNTIPAQFNFVNIIISPEARAGFVTTRLKNYSDMDKQFYRVELQCKPGIPPVSPAAETKVISGKSLPAFVRNLALNASVFAHVHNEGGGEHISMWRHRLRNINQLRERVTASVSTGQAAAPSPGALGGSSSPVGAGGSRRISTATTLTELSSRNSLSTLNGDIQQDGTGEVESILNSFDFSRWS